MGMTVWGIVFWTMSGCALAVMGALLPWPRSIFRAMSTFPSYARVPMAMVATGIGILCYTSVTEYQHHRVKISTSDHVLPADYSLLFRAQRNMYLTGLTLCLMFIIWRLPSFFKAYIESTEIEHPKPKPTSTQSNTPPTNTNKQKKAE